MPSVIYANDMHFRSSEHLEAKMFALWSRQRLLDRIVRGAVKERRIPHHF